jgi:hypothetical protein
MSMPAGSRDVPMQLFEISPRLVRQAHSRAKGDRLAPLYRPLQIYTLDPSVSARTGGVATVLVPYEKLDQGPIGALFEIRSTGAPELLRAEALDLDDPHLLLSSGLSPTPRDGRFHLQMVYAVCSLTYAAFKKALGREIPWAIPTAENTGSRLVVRAFVPGANAGYSREAGDLSFGFFNAGKQPAGFTVAGGLISTALSHDVIAHETTHALLDGLRSSFMEPTNVDVPAFHEGFADLVALFLHFSYADVVERAIREARGTLTRGSLLTDLAREFGYARSRQGKGEALRSGIDIAGIAGFDSDLAPGGASGPVVYDPDLEPHTLGSVLVSAVFEAFVTIVRRKSERWFRIAGVDPSADRPSSMSDALVKAVAQEASDVAAQFLNVCIRAIDYCPPVDIEFGEYLRAVITADGDMERADKWGFREALMRSFRRREILPDHVQFLTEDAMRWQPPDRPLNIPDLAFRCLRFAGEPGQPADAAELERQANALGAFVTDPANAEVFHLISPAGKRPKDLVQAPPAIVQSVRVAKRVTPQGGVAFDLVGEVTQTCTFKRGNEFFDVHGGCTVIVDPDGDVRYAIYKRFDGASRRERRYAALSGPMKKYWEKKGRQWRPRAGMLQRLHAERA